MKYGLQHAVLAACLLSSGSVIAESIIQDRAESVSARLEVLDGLGLRCQSNLEVSGATGAGSPDCEKFLKNIQGDYFSTVMAECTDLLEWYEVKRKYIASAGSDLAESDPEAAQELINSMKVVRSACDTSQFGVKYKYIRKPLNTIKALSSLD